jgi:hypothetical protein
MGYLAAMIRNHNMSRHDALISFHAAVASIAADLNHLGAEWQMGQIRELLSDFAECSPVKGERE